MQLPAHILERLRLLTCLPQSTRVQFRLPDGSDFYLQVERSPEGGNTPESGSVAIEASQVCGLVESPDLDLEMSYDTLRDIIGGQLSARHAFLLGDIRYTGNRELAAALADLFAVH